MSNSGFEKGSYVVYGNNGICSIENIEQLEFSSGTEKTKYYILKPVNKTSSTIYIPANNEKLMNKVRPVMTKEEIDSLLLGMQNREISWEEDRKKRTEKFRMIISTGDVENLLKVIRCIYIKKKELEDMGRELSATDESFLKSAKKLVAEEFAFSLDILKSDVGQYINNLLYDASGRQI